MNRGLLEVVDKTYDGKISTCKIHNAVREMAIKMAEDDAFFKQDGRNCRHLNLTAASIVQEASPKLRELLSTGKTGEFNKITSNTKETVCKSKYLRVLDLSKSIFDEHLPGLLNQIGFLHHLTYLCVSNTHSLAELPASLDKLNNLQILDASYCQDLKTLPACIVNFNKLRILNVSHCDSLKYLPTGLGKLSELEVLLGFKPAKSSDLEGCRIGELKNLSRLRTLGLQLTCCDEIGDTEVTSLVTLNEVQHMSISCSPSDGNGDLITKLDELLPPQKLHELSLESYPGEMSPAWLNPISLPMLRYLSISSGKLAKMNERFWGDDDTVWEIEGLMLEYLLYFEEEWVRVQHVMPALRVVKVSWCPELVSFPIEDVAFAGGVWTSESGRAR